jgi:hypothetical protein
MISDPVVEMQELARTVTARSPKTITADEMTRVLRLIDRIPVERVDFLDTASPTLLASFFAFRREVAKIRAAVGVH